MPISSILIEQWFSPKIQLSRLGLAPIPSRLMKQTNLPPLARALKTAKEEDDNDGKKKKKTSIIIAINNKMKTLLHNILRTLSKSHPRSINCGRSGSMCQERFIFPFLQTPRLQCSHHHPLHLQPCSNEPEQTIPTAALGCTKSVITLRLGLGFENRNCPALRRMPSYRLCCKNQHTLFTLLAS